MSIRHSGMAAIGVITLVLFCACASSTLLHSNEPSNEKRQPDKQLEALERMAAELDGMFNVSARKYADTYFALADIF